MQGKWSPWARRFAASLWPPSLAKPWRPSPGSATRERRTCWLTSGGTACRARRTAKALSPSPSALAEYSARVRASCLCSIGEGQRRTSPVGTTKRDKGILLDVRSDIYSLGATLYHLISGRRPAQDACQSQSFLSLLHLVQSDKGTRSSSQKSSCEHHSGSGHSVSVPQGSSVLPVQLPEVSRRRCRKGTAFWRLRLRPRHRRLWRTLWEYTI